MRAGIPWELILTKGPVLVAAASGLLNGSRRRSDDIAAAKDVVTLRDQVAALASDQQTATDLLRQVADHVSTLAKGAEATAARAQWALIVATIGCVLGFVALLISLVR